MLNNLLDHGVAVKKPYQVRLLASISNCKYYDVPLVHFVWKWESSELQMHHDSAPTNWARLLWTLLIKHSASVVCVKMDQIGY